LGPWPTPAKARQIARGLGFCDGVPVIDSGQPGGNCVIEATCPPEKAAVDWLGGFSSIDQVFSSREGRCGAQLRTGPRSTNSPEFPRLESINKPIRPSRWPCYLARSSVASFPKLPSEPRPNLSPFVGRQRPFRRRQKASVVEKKVVVIGEDQRKDKMDATSKSNAPGRVTLRTGFGPQPLSTKETQPAFGFGSSVREASQIVSAVSRPGVLPGAHKKAYNMPSPECFDRGALGGNRVYEPNYMIEKSPQVALSIAANGRSCPHRRLPGGVPEARILSRHGDPGRFGGSTPLKCPISAQNLTI